MSERHYSVGLGGEDLNKNAEAEAARQAKAVDEANAARSASEVETAKPTQVEAEMATTVRAEEDAAAKKADEDAKVAEEERVRGVVAVRVAEGEDLRDAEEYAARLKVGSDIADANTVEARREADRAEVEREKAVAQNIKDGPAILNKREDKVYIAKEIMDDRHAQRMLEDPEYAAEMHKRVGHGESGRSVDPATGRVVDSRRFETFEASSDTQAAKDARRRVAQSPSDALVAEDARIEGNKEQTPEEKAAEVQYEQGGEETGLDPYRSLNDQ